MYPKEHKRRVVTSSIVNYSIEYFGWCVCEALAVWRENVSLPPPTPPPVLDVLALFSILLHRLSPK